MRRLLLLVAIIIVYGSLYPWHFTFAGRPEPLSVLLHSWPPAWNRFVFRDIVLNVVLYMPLGAIAYVAWMPRFPRAAVAFATALGFALSLAMELLQNYVPGRVTSLPDLATNTLGAVAGALLAMAFAPEIAHRLHARGRHLSPAALLLIGCWAAYQLYPFFPIFSSTHLQQVLQGFQVEHSLSLEGTWTAAAQWFAAALALETILGRLGAAWFPGAMLVLFLRIFMPTRTLALDEVAGAVLAVAIWEIPAPKRRLGVGLFLSLTAIFVAELAPFHFASPPAPFRWTPLSLFENERWRTLVILMQKAFFYGSAVWLMVRAGFRYPVAGLLLAAELLLLEMVQRYLPGRTPEITDSLIALVMTAALWALSYQRSGRNLGSATIKNPGIDAAI